MAKAWNQRTLEAVAQELMVPKAVLMPLTYRTPSDVITQVSKVKSKSHGSS